MSTGTIKIYDRHEQPPSQAFTLIDVNFLAELAGGELVCDARYDDLTLRRGDTRHVELSIREHAQRPLHQIAGPCRVQSIGPGGDYPRLNVLPLSEDGCRVESRPAKLAKPLSNFQRNYPALYAKYLTLLAYVEGMVVKCPTTDMDGKPLAADATVGCGSTNVVYDGEVYDCLDCGIFFSDYAADPPHQRPESDD